MIALSEARDDRSVWGQTNLRIKRLLSMDNPSGQRAALAKLRRGIGQKPGDDPALWNILFEGIPEEMLSRGGEPTREEWAIHTALTLFALHQQGKDPKQDPMNVEGRSLGSAAALLVALDGEDSRPRVARRFNQAATAASMQELTHYLRELVQLLRSKGIGLDYPQLAADLFRYQSSERAPGVRLRWGQDFYRRQNNSTEQQGKDDTNE